jgi:GxxExxY protein
MQIIVPADSRFRNVGPEGKELTLTGTGQQLRLQGAAGVSRQGRTPARARLRDPLFRRTPRVDRGYREEDLPSGRRRQRRHEARTRRRPAADQEGAVSASSTIGKFPDAGFGYVWNLKPELAEKVKKAFFSFQWKGTGVEKEFSASDQTKFVPVSFKSDFARPPSRRRHPRHPRTGSASQRLPNQRRHGLSVREFSHRWGTDGHDDKRYDGISREDHRVRVQRSESKLGCGFLEKCYEHALCLRAAEVGLRVEQQLPLKVWYDDIVVGEVRCGFAGEKTSMLDELKAIQGLDPVHAAICINYLAATGFRCVC